MDEKIIFVLGDKLPRYYDAAIAIFTIAQKPKSDKMKLCIQAYVAALIDIWTKSFGVEHILNRGCVTKRVETLVTNYYNNVYMQATKERRVNFCKEIYQATESIMERKILAFIQKT